MKKLSIIIPCFNEEKTINFVIQKILHLNLDLEIIVVDDNSTDCSAEIVKKIKDERIVYHKHSSNFGKGAAISTGLNFCNGDMVLIQDADLEYDPNEIPRIIRPIMNGYADVVYGSRFKGSGEGRVLYFWHRVGNYLLTMFSNMFTNLNLTDMETCYKAFRSDVIKKIEIKEKRFGVEPEITVKISRLKPKVKIYEIGISYHGRTYEEGKKITWKDGFRALYAIIKYKFF